MGRAGDQRTELSRKLAATQNGNRKRPELNDLTCVEVTLMRALAV